MTIQEIELIILKKAYDETRESGYGIMVDVSDISNKYDLSQEDMGIALISLEKKGFIRDDFLN